MLDVIRRLLATQLLASKENAPMIDVAVLGRVGIDLYPNQLSTPLREVRTYTRFVGGFAGNVATGLARLGVRVAIVSRVGAEGHGDFVRDWLAREGVDVRFLAVDPYWQTPPTFCEAWPPDRFPITFYRKPTAPDWQLSPGDFDAEEVAAAPLLYATGTGLAQSPSRETTLEALRAHRGTTIFDLDWRAPRRCRASRSSRRLSYEWAAAARGGVGAGDAGLGRLGLPLLRRAARAVLVGDRGRRDRAGAARRPLPRGGRRRELGAGRPRERLRRDAVGAVPAARHCVP